ncbi:uncharacterized protein LOC105663660 [Megachile rotundata]|uniref:uncharacterized protein LOC105663660 n=1 Tax=Megachile rotundata TaxID=143995 RepID=UPI000614A3AA|nr:PREDICTED: uncharacterized protein LOC105663660 [Megachile rotundata]
MSSPNAKSNSTRVILEELDAELFIDEVKKYPEIWDINSEENRDKKKKSAAWEKICEKFCSNFRQKTEEEKQELVRKHMNRWRNIRDQYLRTVRKKRRYSNHNRQYIYARRLAFLQEVEKSATLTVSYLDSEEAEDTATVDDDQSTIPYVSSMDEESSGKRNKDTKPCMMNNSQMSNVSCSVEEIDDDKSFFNSILPLIQSFNIEQKIEFRCEVMKLIKKVRTFDIPPGF